MITLPNGLKSISLAVAFSFFKHCNKKMFSMNCMCQQFFLLKFWLFKNIFSILQRIGEKRVSGRFHGFSWFQDGFSCFQVGFHGLSWFQVGFHGFHASRLVFHGFRSFFIVFMVTGWFFMVFHGSKLFFHGFPPECTCLNCILARRSILGPPPRGRHRT